MSRPILPIRRMRIRRTVATWVRMCRLALDGGGVAITITAISTAFAMAGIVGMGGGIGKRAPVFKKLLKRLTASQGHFILLLLW